MLAATSPADEASDELLTAWSNIYGLSPDPSDAWDHAIKAVEAVLIPLVLPTKPRATLGQVLAELDQHPGARQVMLGTSSRKVTPLGTVEANAALHLAEP